MIQLEEQKNPTESLQLAPRILEQVHQILQFWDEFSQTRFKLVVEDVRSLLKNGPAFSKKNKLQVGETLEENWTFPPKKTGNS